MHSLTSACPLSLSSFAGSLIEVYVEESFPWEWTGVSYKVSRWLSLEGGRRARPAVIVRRGGGVAAAVMVGEKSVCLFFAFSLFHAGCR